MPVIIQIETDSDCPNPANNQDWHVFTFNRNLTSFRHPSDAYFQSIGFWSKLRHGTAFPISYYEHSGSVYSLPGECCQCQWDTVQHAGYVVFGGKPRDLPSDRRESARTFLREYTQWANGECYYYSVARSEESDDDGDFLGECGGFIGADYVAQTIREQVTHWNLAGQSAIVRGDSRWITDYHDLGVKVMTPGEIFALNTNRTEATSL